VKTSFGRFSPIEDFSWKSVWWTKVPLKAAFFAWSTAIGKILIMNNLRKQRITVVDRCCMCKKNGESVDHILLHCEVGNALWNVFSIDLGHLRLCLDE
jgi:hypothetical protein